MIKNFDESGTFFSLSVIILCVLLVLSSCIYYKSKVQQQGDKVKYGLIVKFCFQVSDFISDLFFNLILYLENRLYEITYISITLMILSYIGSVITCIYWIGKWSTNSSIKYHPNRFHEYLSEYRILLMGLTLFSNFYVSIDLLTSKLFYLNAFNFPLTKDEHGSLDKYRFFNVVIIENAGQFIIQIIYLINTDISQVNSIVVISMVLSALSISLSLMKFIIYVYTSNAHSYEKLFGNKSIIDGNFIIQHPRFNKFHAFSHSKIEKCLLRFLLDQTNHYREHLLLKKDTILDDISLSCDVYYIENNIKLENELNVYFVVQVLHTKNTYLTNSVFAVLQSLTQSVDANNNKNSQESTNGRSGVSMAHKKAYSASESANTKNNNGEGSNKQSNIIAPVILDCRQDFLDMLSNVLSIDTKNHESIVLVASMDTLHKQTGINSGE